MKVISIINLKGGVGKTTTTVNMAYELSKRGKRVLLIDNDKQGNLSKAFMRYDPDSICGTAEILNGNALKDGYRSKIIKCTAYDKIDLITANMSLMMATFQLTFKEKGVQLDKFANLLFLMKDYYDYCLIDNPPDITLNVVNALVASDEVIVPVKIDEWALEGLDIIKDQINEAKSIIPDIRMLGVLVTMYRNNSSNNSGIEWIEQSGTKLLGKIRYSEKAVDTTFFGKPAYEYSPCSAVAQDYKKFVTSYLEGRI